MINNNGGQHTVLDRITRITPIRGQATCNAMAALWG